MEIVYNNDLLAQLNQQLNRRLRVGWLNSPIHPGYAGRPSHATVASIARFNNHRRPFLNLWIEKIIGDGEIKNLLQHFAFMSIATRVKELLITAMTEPAWRSNSAVWLAFKMMHGLRAEPLFASEVMALTINSEWFDA